MAQSKKIRTPIGQRGGDFRRRALPAIVWTAVAVLSATMLIDRVRRFEYLGLVQAYDYEISANTNGTLETVVVSLFDHVDPGEIVAKLDDQHVRASLETSTAEIRRLNAALGAERAKLSSEDADWNADFRRFQIDEEQRRLDVLSLKVVIESDQVDLERLELEVDRARELLFAGLIGQLDFDTTRLQRDMLHKRIEESLALKAQTEREFEVARARRERFQGENPRDPEDEERLGPLREAISVASYRMTEIELQRQALLLRSPVAGQVSALLCRQGQAVRPGEPILTVTEQTPREIVAYLNEADGETARKSARVLVASRTEAGRVAESLVVRVGPSIQQLPQRLWRNPRIPDYGRPVVIAGVPALDLTPGELVEVRFLPSD
jgi:multidrug resistance efflux pump